MERHQNRIHSGRLKIALIGYGKMGQMIEQMVLKEGHEIVGNIHSKNTHHLASAVENADVCIDFSHPSCVVNNIEQITKLRKNLVVGTTGWDDKLDYIKSLVNHSSIGFIYSPNFSIGCQLFFKMIAHASTLLNPLTEYDIGIFEAHHNQKMDSPSGTAKTISQTLLQNLSRKKQVTCDPSKGPDNETIHLTSLRCGSITGTHSVIFDSPYDGITLTHSAKNREGFAKGALVAAQWLQGKQGFYTFESIMENAYV